MRSILVLNSKGGSGKTTIATNLAAYYALRGYAVALADFDPQGSSTDWLAARPESRSPIRGLEAWESRFRVPAHTDYLVMDAPAAVHGAELAELLRRAQSVIVPVIASPIDLRAAIRFHDELTKVGSVARHRVALATIANRVRENSPSRYLLEDFLRSLQLPDGRRLPFVACLRNSHNYVRAAERGLGLWECAPSLVEHDLDLWRPLLRWLNSKRSLPD